MADLTNKNLGNFRIGHTLGTGGMGTVYKARDTRLDIPVAIKVMHPHFAQKLTFQQRFQQEARSAAAIEHPNIVGVRHFDQEGPHLYMVMEYIPGDNLRELLNALLDKDEWLPLSEAITLVRNVCQAIGHAHKRGVIHRDIKPANIMLKPDEESRYGYRPVITDLGLAKMMGTAGITQTDEIMGTPAYMSPEQVLGPNEAIGAASDIYALGVLLYELVTSAPPFQATRISEVINYHSQEPAHSPDPHALCPELPNSVESIIRRALMRNPQERYASTTEMASVLTAALQQNLPDTRPLTAHYLAGLATLHQESIVVQRGDSLAAQFEQAQPLNRTRDGIQIVTPSGDVRFMNVSAAPMTVGREEDNLLVLRDDPKLSRYHAQIEYKNNRLYVTDNGSTNGVYLDDALLQPNERTQWNKDATLRIGNHYLRLIPAQSSAPPPAAPMYNPANNEDTVIRVPDREIEATAPYPPRKEAKRGLLHSVAKPWVMGLLSVALLAILGGFIFFMFDRSSNGLTATERATATADVPTAVPATAEGEDGEIEIIEASTSTVQVETPTQTDGIEVVEITPPTSTATPILTPRPALVAKNIVNIREGPSTAYPKLGQLQKNQEAIVIGRNSDSTWWQIELKGKNGNPKSGGWVFGGLVTTQNADGVKVAKLIPTLPPPTSTPTVSPTATVPPATVPPPTVPPAATPTSIPWNPQDGEVKVWGGIRFAYVSGGTFLMGSSDSQAKDNEKPQSSRSVAAFWMTQTEVTNAQFRQFVTSDGYSNAAYWTATGWQWKVQNNITAPKFWSQSNGGGDSHPVIGISWYEATAYSRWLSQKAAITMRLPSEAEWEKAARGTDGRIFPWGNNWDPNRTNYCDDQCYQGWKDSGNKHDYTGTFAVGRFESGKSPYNIYDMAGNVLEWTNSLWGGDSSRPQYAYPYVPADGRENVDASGAIRRVLRGGSWGDRSGTLRGTFRSRNIPEHRDHYIGMRLVLSTE